MKVNKAKLNYAMAEACLTTSELGEKTGLPRGTFLNAVVGKNVRPKTAGLIAKALGVKVEDLIEEV